MMVTDPYHANEDTTMTIQSDVKSVADQIAATVAANTALIAKLQQVNTTLTQTIAFIVDAPAAVQS